LNGGITFSPDGNFLAGYDTLFYLCDGGCDIESTLYIWNTDVQTDYLFGCPTFCYGRYGIGDVEFTPDSQTLLWNQFDFPGGEIERGAYYWNAVDLIPVTQDDSDKGGDVPPGLESHFRERTGPFAGDTRSIDFSPDGAWLIAFSDDNLTTLWDVETGKQNTSLPPGMKV
jgi:WD40 repeat protein